MVYRVRFLSMYVVLAIVAGAAILACAALVKTAWFTNKPVASARAIVSSSTTTTTEATDLSTDPSYNVTFAQVFEGMINQDAERDHRSKISQVTCLDGGAGDHWCSFTAEDGQCYGAEVVEKTNGSIVVNTKTAGKVDIPKDQCYALGAIKALK